MVPPRKRHHSVLIDCAARCDTQLRIRTTAACVFELFFPSRISPSSSGWRGRIEMARDCLARVTTGVAVGGAVGGAIGAVYGTYEAFRFKVPGLLKVRYIGQTTVGSAAVFGLFLGAGSLIHCGKSF